MKEEEENEVMTRVRIFYPTTSHPVSLSKPLIQLPHSPTSSSLFSLDLPSTFPPIFPYKFSPSKFSTSLTPNPAPSANSYTLSGPSRAPTSAPSPHSPSSAPTPPRSPP